MAEQNRELNSQIFVFKTTLFYSCYTELPSKQAQLQAYCGLLLYTERTPSQFTRRTKILGIASLRDDFARFLLQFHSSHSYCFSSTQNLGLDINLFLQMATYMVSSLLYNIHENLGKEALIFQHLNFCITIDMVVHAIWNRTAET